MSRHSRKVNAPAVFLVLAAISFFGFIVCLFNQGDAATRADFDLKKQTTESGSLRIYGTIQTGYTLKNFRITFSYTIEDSAKEYVEFSLGTLTRGVNTVDLQTNIPNDAYDTIDYDDCASSSQPFVIPLFCFFGGVIGCLVLAGILSDRRKKKTYPATEKPVADNIEVFDGYGENKAENQTYADWQKRTDALLARTAELAARQAGRDRALDTVGTWARTHEERFDSFGLAALATVQAFDVLKIFARPAFYDEVRDELLRSGQYKVYDDQATNDFLFCCDMVRTRASWEEMLRAVCHSAGDEFFDANEQKTADRGSDAQVTKLIRNLSDEEDKIGRFYAVYHRLTGERSRDRYAHYCAILEGKSAVGATPIYLDARPTSRPIVETPQPIAPTVAVPKPVETPERPKPVYRDTVAAVHENENDVVELFYDYEALSAVRKSVENDGVYPPENELFENLDPSAWRLFFSAGKQLMAARFVARLDKKQAKAFKKATIDAKAELFRDMQSSNAALEEFYYYIYDELGGSDEDIKRDRLKRLLGGRYGG